MDKELEAERLEVICWHRNDRDRIRSLIFLIPKPVPFTSRPHCFSLPQTACFVAGALSNIKHMVGMWKLVVEEKTEQGHGP